MNSATPPPATPAPVQPPRVPHVYLWGVPIVALLDFLGRASEVINNGAGGIVLGLLSIAAAVLTVGVYKAQRKYMALIFPSRNLAAQKWLLLAAIIVPPVSMLAGDTHGRLHFGTASSDIFAVLVYGLLLGVSIALGALYVFAIGNLLYIKTEGRLTALRILMTIIYTIGWVALAAFAYLVYGIAYSLHDPHTE